MAVILEASYSKKLGLPQYSSHQYAVTVRLELADLAQLEKTNAELYAQLQNAVDTQIQRPGFTPAAATGNGTQGPNGSQEAEPAWSCTDRQRELILSLVDEHGLDKHAIESLAQQRFGVGVRQLNRLQASGLIDELLETHGGNGHARQPRRFNPPPRRARR